MLDSTHVPESSGLTASRINPGILWTHNDSGASGPQVWAMRLAPADLAARTAHDMGCVELTGASNRDWEDISLGPAGTIYILDGGDNPPCKRTDKVVLRFREPRITLDAPARVLRLPWEAIRFEYPDSGDPTRPATRASDRYDAECLIVHPISGDLYIITKRTTQDRGCARVYRLPAAALHWNTPDVHVLSYVTDLTGVLGVQANVMSTVTAGDVDADGRRVLVRRYGFAYEFVLPEGRPFDAIWQQTPTPIPLPGGAQGEGICYSPDGQEIYTTSEVVRLKGVLIGPDRCPVYVVPRAKPPATGPASRAASCP